MTRRRKRLTKGSIKRKTPHEQDRGVRFRGVGYGDCAFTGRPGRSRSHSVGASSRGGGGSESPPRESAFSAWVSIARFAWRHSGRSEGGGRCGDYSAGGPFRIS